MGLAASQARLLLLTARQSDLEYRAQIISQRKIMLAMQTEGLATEYTEAIGNKILMFQYGSDSKQTAVLSYNQLTANNPEITGNYIVTDAKGQMVVPSLTSLPAGFNLDNTDAQNPKATFKTASGAVLSYPVNVCKDLSNAAVFQNALRNGGVYLQKYDTTTQQFNNDVWQSDSNIQDTLYTADDELAHSKYEAASMKLQNQDKMLDLELKNIETQHKAIETEVDSVKKVIEKNIEQTYKIFA